MTNEEIKRASDQAQSQSASQSASQSVGQAASQSVGQAQGPKKRAAQKTTTVNGIDCTFQKMIPSEWMKLKSRCTRKGQFVEPVFIQEVLEHIVIQPRISNIDDWDWEDVDSIVAAASDFQTGVRERGF